MDRRPRVFSSRTFAQPAMERLRAQVDLDLWPGPGAPPHEQLLAHLRDAEGVVAMLTDRLDRAALQSAPRLKVVSNFAVGLDNVDLAAATELGIAVGYTPGVLVATVADLAFGLMFAVARRIVEADRFVHQGLWRSWDPNLFLGHDIHGARLGVVGTGGIGRALIERAAAYGMQVCYWNRRQVELNGACQVELGELLAASDFVVLTVALTPQTTGLIGARELALMKPGAFIINVARGPIIDQRALVEALRSGHLGGAGLDVMEVEPIAPEEPLLELPNVVLTPHIGSASHQTRLNMAHLVVDNLLEGLEGRLPRRCANPQVKRAG